jgi:hypothetical protein
MTFNQLSDKQYFVKFVAGCFALMSLIVFQIVKTEETAEKIFLIMSHCSAGSATSKASSNKRQGELSRHIYLPREAGRGRDI